MNEDDELLAYLRKEREDKLLDLMRDARKERNKGRRKMKTKIHTVNSGEIEVVSRDRYAPNASNEIVINNLIQANFRARMATALLEKWGLVAGAPDGEDTTGRQQLRLLSPEEVVDRSIETADIAVSAFEKLGWLDRLPSFSEGEEEAEEIKDE